MPWDELINPLWNELLSYVEYAWLALYSRFIRPEEERLPLPFKLVDSADSPSGGYTSDAPPCATAPPPPILPILTPALLDCASSGSTSVRVDGVTGRSLALQSRLQRSPGYRRRNRFLAYVSRILRGTKAHRPRSLPPCGDQCSTRLLLL